LAVRHRHVVTYLPKSRLPESLNADTQSSRHSACNPRWYNGTLAGVISRHTLPDKGSVGGTRHLTAEMTSNWKIQSVRVVLFPTVPSGEIPDSAANLYDQIWQVAPDSFQRQIPGSPFPSSIAQGIDDGVAVSCVTQPARADFTFAAPQPSPMLPSIPFVDDSEKLYNLLQRFFVKLRSISFSGANRVSLVLQLAVVSNTYTDANKAILSMIPPQYKVALADETDFALQVNTVRPNSTFDYIKMNFLNKWSVERVQLLTFANQPIGTPIGTPGSTQMTQEFIVPVLTFDYNNVPANKPLSKEEVAAIFTDSLAYISSVLRTNKIYLKGFA
jgi:hypothetical protein